MGQSQLFRCKARVSPIVGQPGSPSHEREGFSMNELVSGIIEIGVQKLVCGESMFTSEFQRPSEATIRLVTGPSAFCLFIVQRDFHACRAKGDRSNIISS